MYCYFIIKMFFFWDFIQQTNRVAVARWNIEDFNVLQVGHNQA